jgi:hypothetical protein
MEAWIWLEREGLLAPKPGSHVAVKGSAFSFLLAHQ